MNFDPEIIMAYVDGELDLVTAKRVEKAMEADAALAARIAAEQALRTRLAGHFNPVLDEAVPERLTARLSNIDTSLGERRATKQRRPMFGIMQWSAIAAALVLGLYIGQSGLSDGGAIGNRDGVLVAQGKLRGALDTQLASSQSVDAATRIGLTFRDRNGAICRTFEGASLSGIACRDGQEWQLRQTLSGEGDATAYRQAGSGPIAEAASEMMTGEVFDANAERVALSRRWK